MVRLEIDGIVWSKPRAPQRYALDEPALRTATNRDDLVDCLLQVAV